VSGITAQHTDDPDMDIFAACLLAVLFYFIRQMAPMSVVEEMGV